LGRIERARGARFLEFLRTYGLVGALALELTRVERDESRWSGQPRRCSVAILPGGGCDACPLHRVACTSWYAAGHANMERTYRQLLRASPFWPGRG
jgi:hypothetical protein